MPYNKLITMSLRKYVPKSTFLVCVWGGGGISQVCGMHLIGTASFVQLFLNIFDVSIWFSLNNLN